MINEKIKRLATDNATSIFNNNIKSNTIKYDDEEISNCAQLEADKFYRSGKIFFLPVFFFGKEDAIKHIYKETFFDIYTAYSKHYKLRHP